MLPTAGPLPTANGWVFELKWDGLRAAAAVRGGRLRRLQSRLGNDLAAQFPELTVVGDALGDVVLDGELVVLADNNIPDWDAVERRRKARSKIAGLAAAFPATVMVFDVLAAGGEDLRRRPYRERRTLLEELDFADRWQVPPVSEDGQAMVAVSLAYGLEGVVAKRASSRYSSGKRTRDWIKVRHRSLVDAVVVGWRRRESGGVTLLLAEAAGEDADGDLFYLGRCIAPRAIAEELAPLAVRTPAVAVPDAGRDVQWVRPELEVEVAAAARTPDGRLRQPRFVRARMDLR